MENQPLKDIISHLKRDKRYLYNFGVTRIGIFGSFARGENTFSSDLDIVVEMERDKKTFIVFYNLRDIWKERPPEKLTLVLNIP